jgi:hypothetical protein
VTVYIILAHLRFFMKNDKDRPTDTAPILTMVPMDSNNDGADDLITYDDNEDVLLNIDDVLQEVMLIMP